MICFSTVCLLFGLNKLFFSVLLAFQVISEEGKSSKLIVLVKNAEKLFTEYTELLSIEPPLCVMIIGCQTETEKDDQQVYLHTFEKTK